MTQGLLENRTCVFIYSVFISLNNSHPKKVDFTGRLDNSVFNSCPYVLITFRSRDMA